MTHRLARHALPRLLLGLFAGAASAASAPASPPPALQGDWVVQQVAVDRNDQIRRSHEPDDPRVLGGILKIGADGGIDPAEDECAHGARWTAQRRTTLAALVARHVRESGGIRTRPSLEDYGLKIGNPALAPFAVSCAAAGARPQPYQGADAFASISKDVMISDNGSDTVLVYRRLTPDTPVQPSFACKGALSDSEKAICGSQELAGLDRSVALAWQRAQQRLRSEAAKLSALRTSQQAWIKTRDACKADADCLSKAMSERIDELVQQQ